MIRQEYYTTRKDGITLYKTYSDNNKMIIQVETGIEYSEAIDVYPIRYTYIETENDIQSEEQEQIGEIEV
jgi:hypothetical protein